MTDGLRRIGPWRRQLARLALGPPPAVLFGPLGASIYGLVFAGASRLSTRVICVVVAMLLFVREYQLAARCDRYISPEYVGRRLPHVP